MLGYEVLLTSHHTIAHKGTYELDEAGAASSLLTTMLRIHMEVHNKALMSSVVFL